MLEFSTYGWIRHFNTRYVLVPRQEPRAATSSFLDRNVHELYMDEVFLDISIVACLPPTMLFMCLETDYLLEIRNPTQVPTTEKVSLWNPRSGDRESSKEGRHHDNILAWFAILECKSALKHLRIWYWSSNS